MKRRTIFIRTCTSPTWGFFDSIGRWVPMAVGYRYASLDCRLPKREEERRR
jgi:hypothetical protein